MEELLPPWLAWPLVVLIVFLLVILRRRQPREKVDHARQLTESQTAGHLIGTQVTLRGPLYPDTGKLEIRGRFWKISGTRSFPAGSKVEVVGHRGDTLDVVGAETTHYQTSRQLDPGRQALKTYQRDPALERPRRTLLRWLRGGEDAGGTHARRGREGAGLH